MIFLYGGMVWGVELVPMVWVGGGIKKARGLTGAWKYALSMLL